MHLVEPKNNEGKAENFATFQAITRLVMLSVLGLGCNSSTNLHNERHLMCVSL